MFERFTDRARRIVVLAQEEARRRGHAPMTIDDVWNACYLEGEGVAAQVLTDLGYEYEPPENDSIPMVGHIEASPEVKKVWGWALREALKLGHNYIGTEHILLGLLRTGWVGGQLGASPNAIRSAVFGALRAHVAAASTEPVHRPHRVTLTPLGEGRWRAALEIGDETVVAAEADNQLDATATALDDLGRRLAAGETF